VLATFVVQAISVLVGETVVAVGGVSVTPELRALPGPANPIQPALRLATTNKSTNTPHDAKRPRGLNPLFADIIFPPVKICLVTL